MSVANDSSAGGFLHRLQEAAVRFTGAEPHELPRAVWLFTYNFLVITAYLIVKPVRNSLFLDRLGAENLPYAYIGTALFVGMACWAYFRLLDRLPRTGVVATTWSMLAGGLVAFWFGFLQGGVWVSALFYFFSAVFAVVGVTQFWSFTSEVLDAHQGRRLIGFIQIGGILGGLAGGVITRSLATVIGTEQLLLVSAALCTTCGVIAVRLSQAWPVVAQEQEEEPAAAEEQTENMAAAGGFSLVAGSRYLLLICTMIFCFQMVSTLVDYQFHHVVGEGFAAKDARTAFYGTFFFCLNTASLLFQTFLTTRIHRRQGAGVALAMLPLVGLLGSAGFFLLPVFWMGAGVRWAFGTLDYSLDRATRELLYLPTTREEKYKAKAFIDMFCFRFFRCLAGIVILFVAQMKGVPVQNLSLAVIAVSAVWLGVTVALREENIRQIRKALCGDLDPAIPFQPLGALARQELVVDLGYELRRYMRSLDPDCPISGLEEKSFRRIEAITGRLYGESDVKNCLAALAEGGHRRPLAQELLDGIADADFGRMLMKAVDGERPLRTRLRLCERVLVRIGDLPARPAPRVVWEPATASAG